MDDILYFVVASGVWMLHVAITGRSLRRWFWESGAMEVARAAVVDLRLKALACRHALRGHRGPKDATQRFVTEELDRKLVDFTRRCIPIVTGPILGYMSLHLVLDLREMPRFLTRGQDLALCCLSFIFAMARLWPAAINKRTLDAWQLLFGCCVCLVFIFSDPTEEYILLRMMTFVAPFRMIQGLVSRVRCNVVLNIVYCFSVLMSYVRLEGPKSTNFATFAIMEVLTSIAIALAAIINQSNLVREIEQGSQVRSLSIESSAMTKLLDLVCDVVFQLDADLRIMDHVPRLAAMLGTQNHTNGISFQRFMADTADQNNFAELLGGAAANFQTQAEAQPAPGGAVPECAQKAAAAFLGNSCLPGALHATLRDSMSNNIYVEIFYVVFQGLDGARSYFVGVREFTDQPVAELKKFDISAPASASSNGGRGPGAGARTNIAGLGTAAIVPSQSLGGSRADGDADDNDAGGGGSGNDAGGDGSVPSGVRGCAGDPEDELARCDSDASSSVVSCFQSARGQLTNNKLKPTGANAQRLTLVGTLLKWNVHVPYKSCCPYHAAIRELRRHVKHLQVRACQPGYQPSADAQCRYCGILADWNESPECEVCLTPTVERCNFASL